MSHATSTRSPGLLVIFCGLITTTISLVIVTLLAGTDFNVIGWYWLFVIPLGAILVGLASGTGYYFASKWTNSKIVGVFVWLILLISITAYVISHFISYRMFVNTEEFTFIQYIQAYAEGLSFEKSGSNGEYGDPLGKLGYFFLLLEGLGVSIGSIYPVASLWTQAYCDRCNFYLKKQRTGFISSDETTADLRKKKKPEKEDILVGAINSSIMRTGQLFEENEATPYETIQSAIGHLDQSQKKKALANVTVELFKCPACDTHQIKATLINQTTGGSPATSELAKLIKPS